MEHARAKELHFLIRIKAPIPITDSRQPMIFQTMYYDDFYTIQELISEGYLEYVGHQKSLICLRPFIEFRMYISGEIRKLQAGEIITMSLSTLGKTEFEKWIATTKEQ